MIAKQISSYYILSPFGEGEMGNDYRAYTQLDREVAIARIHPKL